MAIERVTTAALKYFEQQQLAERAQLDQALFSELDMDLAAAIEIDDLLGQGFAAASAKGDSPAPSVLFTPGRNSLYTPQFLKRKTPIDGQLSDATIAGLPKTSPYAAIAAKRIRQIISGPFGFMPAFKMSKIKMALEVYETGKLTYYDEDGDELEQVNFGRDAGLTQTYNFATSGNNMDGALKALYEPMRDYGIDDSELAVIMGADWINEFMNDTSVQNKMQNNVMNQTVQTNIMPEKFKNIQGLRVIGRYLPSGMSAPVLILAYSPGTNYKATADASDEPFLAKNKVVMLSMATRTIRYYRGFLVKDPASGATRRVTGDLVIYSHVNPEPVVENLIAQCRPFFYVSNINHTGCCTGTFA